MCIYKYYKKQLLVAIVTVLVYTSFMRKVKYIRNTHGFCLENESLKDKPKKVLQVLSTTSLLLRDDVMSKECGMNLRTYKRWKNYLVMVGLLQVRQLNAMTYLISIGQDAIENDDKFYGTRDYKKIASKLFTKNVCTILIDSDTFIKNDFKDATFEEIDKYLEANNISYYGERK
jgi:hypothetical protein